jgi:hypothetical protein
MGSGFGNIKMPTNIEIPNYAPFLFFVVYLRAVKRQAARWPPAFLLTGIFSQNVPYRLFIE